MNVEALVMFSSWGAPPVAWRVLNVVPLGIWPVSAIPKAYYEVKFDGLFII